MVFNGAELHLLVNHIPVVGFIGIVIALIVCQFIESVAIKRFVPESFARVKARGKQLGTDAQSQLCLAQHRFQQQLQL